MLSDMTILCLSRCLAPANLTLSILLSEEPQNEDLASWKLKGLSLDKILGCVFCFSKTQVSSSCATPISFTSDGKARQEDHPHWHHRFKSSRMPSKGGGL